VYGWVALVSGLAAKLEADILLAAIEAILTVVLSSSKEWREGGVVLERSSRNLESAYKR
jgi:hypothetical protein